MKSYINQPTDPRILMRRIMEQAYDILASETDAPGEETAAYRTAITLIGREWNLAGEAEEALRILDATTPSSEGSLPGEALTSSDNVRIQETLWGLFDTAIRLENRGEREQVLQLAVQMMEFYDLDGRLCIA